MTPQLDCLPCIIKHMIKTVSETVSCPEMQKKTISEILQKTSEIIMDFPPPVIAREINRIISKNAGTNDIFRRLKDESTDFALDLLPSSRQMVSSFSSPFEASIRIATAANIIDFGACHDFSLSYVEKELENSLISKLDLNAIRLLEEKIFSASKILFIADNCGEAVFDRLIIEPYKEKITIAVRGFPILNDVTPREARLSGFYEITKVIDTGDSTPGIHLDDCSDTFMEFFQSADLIISKGQGNFETLYYVTDRPIFFLLKTKCQVISNVLNTEIGTMNIIHKNIQ